MITVRSSNIPKFNEIIFFSDPGRKELKYMRNKKKKKNKGDEREVEQKTE